MVKLRIITCPLWRARKPKSPPILVGASHEIIFHHTAGHHQELDSPNIETEDEAKAYARMIQNYHMDSNGWNDSGHNFLVCRNGLVLQGRWRTVAAIQVGQMVVSAHCPKHNDQIGIEHEHFGLEEMPAVQKEASARLMAWIADKYKRTTVLSVHPHSEFFGTACPANLKEDIPGIVKRAQSILDNESSKIDL